MAIIGECGGNRGGAVVVRSPGKRKKRHSPVHSCNGPSNRSSGAPTYRQRLNNELCSGVSSIGRRPKGEINGSGYGCSSISSVGGPCGDPTPRKKRQVGELLSFTSFPESLPSVSGVGCSPKGKGGSGSGKAVMRDGGVGVTAPATNPQQDGVCADAIAPPMPPLVKRGNNNNNSMWFEEDATNAVARLSFSPGLGQASKNMTSSYVMPSPIPVRRGSTPSKALGEEKILSSALAPSSSGLRFPSGAEYKDEGAPPREEFEEIDMRCSPSQDEECSRSAFALCSQNAGAYTPNMRLDLQGCSQNGMVCSDTQSRRGSIGSLGRFNSLDIGMCSSQDVDMLASSLRLDAAAFSQGGGNGDVYTNEAASPVPRFDHPLLPPPQYDAPTPICSLNSEELDALPFPNEASAMFRQGSVREERGKSFELMHRCIEEEEDLERTTIQEHGGGGHRGSTATVDLDWQRQREGGGGDIECQCAVVGDGHECCECRGSIEREGETESGRSSPFLFCDEEIPPGLQEPLFGQNGPQYLPSIKGGGNFLHTPSSSFGSMVDLRERNKTPSFDSSGRETPNSHTMACPPTPERNPVWLNLRENGSGRGGDDGNNGGRNSASGCLNGNGRKGGGRLVRRNSLQITKLLAGRSVKGGRTAPNSIRFNRDFVNLGIIGQGQFALVYKVRSLLDGGRLYAVKRSKKIFRSKADRTRSMQEVLNLQRVAACLYVVHFERAWQEEGYFYYQAELCELGNLQTVVKHVICGGKSIPNNSLWKVAHDVGEGLHFLHENNLVHLDVKPSNIFLCLSGRLKLGDFGLAIAFGTADIDSEGDICYMAKELLETSERYPSADMFSLGITLYAMAAGMLELPMRGQGWHDLREGNPPPLPKDCCPRLREVIASLMHPNAKERLTANALRQEPLASAVKEVDTFLLNEGKAAAKGLSSTTKVSKKGNLINSSKSGSNLANPTPRQCRYSNRVKSIIEKVAPKGELAAAVPPTPVGRWKDL